MAGGLIKAVKVVAQQYDAMRTALTMGPAFGPIRGVVSTGWAASAHEGGCSPKVLSRFGFQAKSPSQRHDNEEHAGGEIIRSMRSDDSKVRQMQAGVSCSVSMPMVHCVLLGHSPKRIQSPDENQCRCDDRGPQESAG